MRYDYCLGSGCKLTEDELHYCFDCKLFESIVKPKERTAEEVLERRREIMPDYDEKIKDWLS